MKKNTLLIVLLLIITNTDAQNLVPYQVQDLKKWEDKPWGYKDKNFNVIIQPINESPNLFKNGYCVLEKNGKMGLMDAKGNIVLEPIYESCSDVQGDFVSIKDGFFSNEHKNKPYAFNLKTKQVFFLQNEANININFQFSGIDGVLITRLYDPSNKSTRYGLGNFKNEILLPNIYKEIDKIDDGHLRVKTIDGLYGFVNAKTWVETPSYNYLGRFKDGLALIEQNNKWGFINNEGKQILPIKYDKAYAFQNGFADVTYNKDYFIIDTAGKALFESDKIRYMKSAINDLFIVKHINDSTYILNKDGKNLAVDANDIVTADGKSFLMLVGKSVYSLVNNKITSLPINNAVSIGTTKMGFYSVNSKAENEEKKTVSIFNIELSVVIANQEKFFKYREQGDLQLLEAYWEVKKSILNWEDEVIHNVYSYISLSGKTYSDITK